MQLMLLASYPLHIEANLDCHWSTLNSVLWYVSSLSTEHSHGNVVALLKKFQPAVGSGELVVVAAPVKGYHTCSFFLG